MDENNSKGKQLTGSRVRAKAQSTLMGVFAEWQAKYAAAGIATFPVKIEGKDKKPLIKGYQRTGLKGSAELARKFTKADALALMLGPRSKVEIIDVDTKDERALADALSTYGDTRVISRTASGGGFHAWYRHSAEAVAALSHSTPRDTPRPKQAVRLPCWRHDSRTAIYRSTRALRVHSGRFG